MTLGIGRWAALALASTAVLGLSACDSNGSYRVASVGTTAAGTAPDGGDSGDGTGTGSGSGSGGTAGSGSGSGSASNGQGGLGSKVLVSSGNAVMGLSGTQAGATAGLGIPGSGVVDATVTGTLKSTGQTLVQLGDGGTLVLNGKGGKLGDVVSIDLGQGKVIGNSGGSALVGLNVLARNPTTGSLVTVGGANNNLVSVTAPGTGTGGLLNGTGGVLNGTSGNASLTGTAGNVVNTTLKGAVNPSGNSGVSSLTNVVTQPVTGTLGVTGGTPPK